VTALARREGLCNHYAGDLLPLAYLAPDLVEQILVGRQPRALTLAMLTKQPLPLDWDEQRARVRLLAAA
jgi:site-specific DNA recombinase